MEEEFYRRDPRSSRGGPSGGRGPEAIDQRLERWVSRGRALVDGVSGSRPGSRPPASGERAGQGVWNPGRLGRWVEDRIDALLEDDDEDWREPWQQNGGTPQAPPPPAAPQGRPSGTPGPQAPGPSGRRALEAISRRGPRPPAATGPVEAGGEAWPDDDSFSVPRWSRPSTPRANREEGPQAPPPPPDTGGGRLLPRSSRRR